MVSEANGDLLGLRAAPKEQGCGRNRCEERGVSSLLSPGNGSVEGRGRCDREEIKRLCEVVQQSQAGVTALLWLLVISITTWVPETHCADEP